MPSALTGPPITRRVSSVIHSRLETSLNPRFETVLLPSEIELRCHV